MKKNWQYLVISIPFGDARSCFWSVAPPMWFAFEFWLRAEKLDQDLFVRFKYSQELGSRLWWQW